MQLLAPVGSARATRRPRPGNSSPFGNIDTTLCVVPPGQSAAPQCGPRGDEALENLRYFTHVIDGKMFGGWYRVLSPHDLEVLGVGMLEVVRFGGFDPEQTARSVLEDFVRRRMQSGKPVPAIDPATA